jgi:capsular polysaccharide transport system permease protein
MSDTPPPSPPVTRTPWQVQRAVLFALFQRDLKARFGGRWLGAFWVLFEPLAHVAVLMVLFAYFRERLVPGIPYVLFLVTGLLPFFVFRGISLRLMGAIDGSRGVFGYRQVQPLDTLLVRAGLEILTYSAVYLAFLVGLGWLGFQWFPDQPLELAGASFTLIVLGFSLGVLFAVGTDDLPQLRVVIRIAYFPLYLISGVIFPVGTLHANMIDWLDWNPLLHLLEMERAFFVSDYRPIQSANMWYPAGVSLVALAAALSCYRLRRRRLLAT